MVDCLHHTSEWLKAYNTWKQNRNFLFYTLLVWQASHLVVVNSLKYHSYLEMRLEHTAVDTLIMSLKHSQPLSWVNGIDSNGAAIWNKNKLWAAAPGDSELQSFPAVVTNLPIVHLQNSNHNVTHFLSALKKLTKTEKKNHFLPLLQFKETNILIKTRANDTTVHFIFEEIEIVNKPTWDRWYN